MKNTLEYTKKITLFNEVNISEEQQICLLKTTDFVKKKAMDKLNEIKSKSEDSASSIMLNLYESEDAIRSVSNWFTLHP